MGPASRTLSTAEIRRDELVEAAIGVFAERGIHGTPTTELARAAGISQAYLFRLFPSKELLAVAAVERTHERIRERFADAAREAHAAGLPVLPAMGAAYAGLLEDRELLLVQLHAHAAAPSVAAIRDANRVAFARLVELVERESDAGPEEIGRFFARGMLLNVLAALDAGGVDAHWVRVLSGTDPELNC
jgi:AcrR family transcriptional regulator